MYLSPAPSREIYRPSQLDCAHPSHRAIRKHGSESISPLCPICRLPWAFVAGWLPNSALIQGQAFPVGSQHCEPHFPDRVKQITAANTNFGRYQGSVGQSQTAAAWKSVAGRPSLSARVAILCQGREGICGEDPCWQLVSLQSMTTAGTPKHRSCTKTEVVLA